MGEQEPEAKQKIYGTAEIGALAHLYRGEMFQSKVWRGRIDVTTNWAVVVVGIALSVTFSSADASPLPVLLSSWVVVAFLVFEARRYLYYDLFRIRVRVMEINLYGPLLRGEGIRTDNGWTELLADDYRHLRFHISYWEALGRRLRRNYIWLFAILYACYVGKIIVHPVALESFAELWQRAAIGPIPGKIALTFGVLFHLFWVVVAVATMRRQKAVGLPRHRTEPDRLYEVAAGRY